MSVRAVHCLNQYFAGLGGEESADTPPQWLDGPKGPGNLFAAVAPDIEIVATIAVGDNYKADDPDAAAAEIAHLIEQHREALGGIDLVLAGPAFNAGRYGMRCAALCREAERRLGVPALTALYPDNPAVAIYRRDVTILRAADDVMGMRDAVAAMAAAALKRITGEALSPEDDGALPRGVRENVFAEQTGAVRALDMLLRKLAGADPATEYAMPCFDRVPPAPALADAAKATIALVTSGGIVPRGNPDRIESASASRYGA
jgi:betaine reductase